VAHAGVETSFAKPGQNNPNVPAGNVFSFQPLDPSKRELARQGIKVTYEGRGNRINGVLQTTKTPTPQFASLRQAIQVQLDLVFGGAVPADNPAALKESFKEMGEELKRSGATAASFGASAGTAGYAGTNTPEGARYRKTLMGTHTLALDTLKRFAGHLPSTVSPEARQFLEDSLAHAAKQQ
jgi:hypothetical protein